MAEKNLIKIYVDASSAKRVDIIIKHYTDFIGIVDGYTEGLRYMIESEKDSNSHRLLVSWMERWEVLRNGRKAMLYRQGITGDFGNQQTNRI